MIRGGIRCLKAGVHPLALAAILFAGFSLPSTAAPRFVPGQILVKPKAGLSEADFASRLRAYSAWQRQSLGRHNVRVLGVSEDRAEAVLAALRSDPGIEFAERDALAKAAFIPNDPLVVSGSEWHLAKIQALRAWDVDFGSSKVVVAILDSGIDAAHPDLAGHVLAGYDFVGGDTDVSDDFGHGTAVAGVVVAAGNNGVGVAGVAYGCSVLPVKVMDSSGFASYSCLAQGIYYAVDQGAQVINISIAGDSPSVTLQEAIDYAWSNNVVVVAAAGNNANAVPQYPAACDNVVAVSATEPDDSLASFSSYGSFVSLSAPGDDIWTTQNDALNPYGAWRGTSFASPIVAATAALALSANSSLSNSQIVSILEQNADDLGAAGYDTTFGYGRVNALRVVCAANPELAVALNTAASDPPAVDWTSPADATEFSLGAIIPLQAVAAAATGGVAQVVFLAGSNVVAAFSAPPFVAQWTPPGEGSFVLTAVVTDTQGLTATSAPVTVIISGLQAAAPLLKITTGPPNHARLEAPAVSLAGIASSSAGIGHVEVQLNGGPAQVADGDTNWSAQVSLVPGPNVVEFRCFDLAGNVSPAITRALTYVVNVPLALATNGLGRISPDLDGRQLEIGKTYTLRAIPGPGQVFAGWTGIASSSPDLTFQMRSNLSLAASFVPTPFPVVQGNYAGLAVGASDVTPDNSGFCRLTVTSLGCFTGKLLSAGRSYGFRGRFDLSGDTTLSVPRGGLAPLSVALHADLTSGTDQIVGRVTDGDWSSDLVADRNVFNARTNPASQAGLRSFILESADDSPTLAATGSSRIAAGGGASVRGKLVTGHSFGTASALARNGDCPFYLSLNRGTQVIIGWLNFPAGQAPLAAGTVLWAGTGTNAFAATLRATSAE